MCINRIRLEFKDKMGTNIQDIQNAVLIESDWNLKGTLRRLGHPGTMRINRIRLEFKGCGSSIRAENGVGINRIRLEFKVFKTGRDGIFK